ncbi:MAG: hypothetical protein OEW11_03650 [Nitrospirota bacterium]|nr:hypothetical protein [Nitrospirota bacterium]
MKKFLAGFSLLIFCGVSLSALNIAVRADNTESRTPAEKARVEALLAPPGPEYDYVAIQPHSEELARLCQSEAERANRPELYQVIHDGNRTLRSQQAGPVVEKIQAILNPKADTQVARGGCTPFYAGLLLGGTSWRQAASLYLASMGAFINSGEYGAAVQVAERLRDTKETRGAGNDEIPQLDRLIPHLHQITSEQALLSGDLPRANLFAYRSVNYITLRGEAFPGQMARAVMHLSAVKERMGHAEDAEVLAANALFRSRYSSDDYTTAVAARRLAEAASARGDASLATKFSKQSVAAYREADLTDRPDYTEAQRALDANTIWPTWLPYRERLPG